MSIEYIKMSCQIQIISIEGNIGSGKSTLLAYLKNYFRENNKIIFLKEPVDEWSKIKDDNGTTILEKFYNDQEKYSFSFQMMAYISRLKLLRDTVKEINDHFNKTIINETGTCKYFIITERSLFTDKMVFAKMLYDSGKIETVNYQIYLNWFNTFADEYKVDKIIYVKAKPDVCHYRIAKRHRDGEDNIPLNYLKECDTYHNNMLDKSLIDCVCYNQLVLDGNIDIYENVSVLNDWILSIESYIYN